MRYVVDEFKQQKNKVADRTRPIYLYSIQYDEAGNKWLYYANFGSNITFDGILYKKYVIRHDGTRENLSGRVEKVRLTLGNVTREMQYYLESYDGLKGCKIEIRMVWFDTLDNPNSFIKDTYYVEDSNSNPKTAILMLGSGLDVLDIQLPRRCFYRYYCRFKFKDASCGYSGSQASCNKTFKRCDELGNIRRFGGFPGIPMKRMLIR